MDMLPLGKDQWDIPVPEETIYEDVSRAQTASTFGGGIYLTFSPMSAKMLTRHVSYDRYVEVIKELMDPAENLGEFSFVKRKIGDHA